MPIDHQGAADGVDDGAGGRRRHEQEAGDERADEGAERRDAAQPADDAAGALEVVELQLHDHRRDRAEHDGREEEGGEREEERGAAAALARLVAERAHHRDGEQREQPAERHRRAEQPARIDAVGELAAAPCADRDPGEHGPDDRGVGLEADPHVRREQAAGEDLEHEDGRRAHEHERGGHDFGHRRSLAVARFATRSADAGAATRPS